MMRFVAPAEGIGIEGHHPEQKVVKQLLSVG